MKSATQPRNRFTALVSKQKMSRVKRINECYLRDTLILGNVTID